MGLPLRVTVIPDRATASPGDSLTFVVSVRNVGDTVEHYAVDVLGLPDGTVAHADPEVAKLRPQESADLNLHLTVQGQPPPLAGTYVLGVLVKSKYRDDVSRCVELPLEVAAVRGITVQPAPEIGLGGASATFAVRLTNSGNTALRLRLSATDPERRVGVLFAPDTVELASGATAHSVLIARAPVPWSKEKNQRLTIEAAAADPGGGPPIVMGQGCASFVQKPRIASTLARAIGMGAAVLLIAAAIAIPPLVSHYKQAAEKQPRTPGAQTPSASATAPSASAGASASASAAAGSSPPSEESSTEPAPAGPQQRTVNLTAPGGVPADGVLEPSAFSDEGLTVSAAPGPGAAPGCENVRAVAVVQGLDGVPALVPANPGNPALCNDVPMMMDFPADHPAATLTVLPAVMGALRMQVFWQDRSRTDPADLTATRTPDGPGIDYVVLAPPTPGAGTPVAVREIRFAPLA